MKVLLTGASGFVGSHVLDTLRARGIPTAILLRASSSQQFTERHLGWVEPRLGSITDEQSLRRAMAGISQVIHCAGATKASRNSEFYEINQAGTRHVVDMVNELGLQRLVHISSLAATGPAVPSKPANEEDSPNPVSEYGKSKLAGELEVRKHCKAEFVIVRPPAVYGPRDPEFLRMFKAVKGHLLPRPANQALSLVYVKDLAEAIVTCLERPEAAGKTYFVAAPEIVTARTMAEEIAAQVKVWTVPLPLPAALLWPVCMAHEIRCRVTGKPSVLSLQKFAELCAPGWVCDPGLIKRELGFTCQTGLKQGIAETLRWYQENRWL